MSLKYIRDCLILGADTNIIYSCGTPLDIVMCRTISNEPLTRSMVILLLVFGAYPESEAGVSPCLQDLSGRLESARIFAKFNSARECSCVLLPDIMRLIIEKIVSQL